MRRTIKQLYFQNWWWAYGMKTLMAYNANKVFRPSFWLVTSGFVLWIFSDSVPGTPQSQLPSAKQLPFVIQWSQVDMYSVYKLTITCNKLTNRKYVAVCCKPVAIYSNSHWQKFPWTAYIQTPARTPWIWNRNSTNDDVVLLHNGAQDNLQSCVDIAM